MFAFMAAVIVLVLLATGAAAVSPACANKATFGGVTYAAYP